MWQKNIIEQKKISLTAARLITAALFVAAMAGGWDGWWHISVGRDTLWIPPHLLLYSSILVALMYGFYAWVTTQNALWKRLAYVMVFIPLSAPFDDMWHGIFGIEPVNSLLIIWSPPHVVLVLAIAASFLMLLPILRLDRDVIARRLLTSMAFAGIINALFFLISPFQPTGGFGLAGFWGAGLGAVVLIGSLLIARTWIGGFAAVTLVSIFILLISSVSFGSDIVPDVVVIPHDHSKPWIVVFSLLLPSLYLDFVKHKLWLQAAVASLLWAGLIYGFSSLFFEVQFHYSVLDGVTAIFASLLGGLFIGVVLSRLQYFKK